MAHSRSTDPTPTITATTNLTADSITLQQPGTAMPTPPRPALTIAQAATGFVVYDSNLLGPNSAGVTYDWMFSQLHAFPDLQGATNFISARMSGLMSSQPDTSPYPPAEISSHAAGAPV